MKRFAFAFAAVALCALSVAGQDAVEIKLYEPKAGDRYKVVKTEKTKTTEMIEVNGNKKNSDKDEAKNVVYTEEVVVAAKGDGKPEKLVRVYEKYEDNTEKGKAGPPLKTPITVAKKDGKYTFTADGKELGDFAKTLDEEFNKPADEPTNKDFLPGKAVKAGDSWKIDTTKFVKSLSEKVPVDAKAATMTGKLLKTYQQNGARFGTIEMKADFPITGLGPNAPPVKTAGIKMTLTADACIDGTVADEKLKTLLRFDVVVDTKDVKLNINADGVITETTERLPKK